MKLQFFNAAHATAKRVNYLVAALALSSHAAMGAPSAFVSKFGALNITNDTSSTLLRDTESPNKVWVLPPASGLTAMKGFSPSANNSFCAGLKEIAIASNDVAKRVGNLRKQVEALEPELKAAEAKLIKAREDQAKYGASTAMEQITQLRDTIERLSISRTKIISDLELCTDQCTVQVAENKRLSDEIRETKYRLWELEDKHRETVYAFKKAENATVMAENAYNEVGSRINKLHDMYIVLDDKLLEMYGRRGKLEGGTAFIDYDTGWAKNVQELELRYPSYDFSMIPTYNTRIFANLVGASSEESYIESLPALLDYSINGVKFQPWAERSLEQSSMPNIIAGNLRLSLIGSCPLVDSSFFKNVPNFTPSKDAQGNPLYSISATYEYPAAFKHHVKATYNLYKMYEIIKKNSKKGGFFSSSSYSSVVEDQIDRDSFKFEFMDESINSLSESDKKSVRDELRKTLIDRVLVMTSQPTAGEGNYAVATVGMPPEPGSLVAARGLSKVCGFNLYCQAGSWILRTGAAAFGSSTAESHFKSTWDRTAQEEWSDTKVMLRPGATVFAR